MFLGALALFNLVGLSASLATIPDKPGKTGPDPRYDVATVIDEDATVVDTREMPRDFTLSGVHLIVKIDSETVDVYLGPVDYLKDFEITFAKGDKIEVIGSKVKFDGARIVLARQVRRDETTLYLRDVKGKPHWKE